MSRRKLIDLLYFNTWVVFLCLLTALIRSEEDYWQEENKLIQKMFFRLEDIEELLHVDYAQFSCQVPGCGLKFSQLHESETHYAAAHRSACHHCSHHCNTQQHTRKKHEPP